VEKLTPIDKRILYALGNDARLVYKELAQSINSKKSVVTNHVQQLIQKEIIWKFVPVLSIHRLGICAYKVYVKVHGLDKSGKKKLIDALINDPHINWVAEGVGSWDILWSVYAYNILDFAKKKNDFLDTFGNYVQEYAVTVLEDALVFNRDYLVNAPLDYRKEFTFGGASHLEHIDEFQKDILRYIRNNGRYHITKLANALGMNVRTAMVKIKDLEQKEIIQGYTTFIHLDKIGMQFFKLCLFLQDYSLEQHKKIVAFCKSNKQVVHIIKSIGPWDLEVECEVKDSNYIYSFIEDLKAKYPRTVKKVDIVFIQKEHKLDFFPQWY